MKNALPKALKSILSGMCPLCLLNSCCRNSDCGHGNTIFKLWEVHASWTHDWSKVQYCDIWKDGQQRYVGVIALPMVWGKFFKGRSPTLLCR